MPIVLCSDSKGFFIAPPDLRPAVLCAQNYTKNGTVRRRATMPRTDPKVLVTDRPRTAALDNVEVSKVDIWREKVGTETVSSNGLVYIGDAVFVARARPDVQGLYPTYPNANRAGWGYQMLTNFLPQGNGTFKLHAIHDFILIEIRPGACASLSA